MLRDPAASGNRSAKSSRQSSRAPRSPIGNRLSTQKILQSVQGIIPPHPPESSMAIVKSADQVKSVVGTLSQQTRNWVIGDWRIFTLLSLIVTGGLATYSVSSLYRLPALPNCPAIFWPLASASLRVQCAQIAARKQTVDDLLEAIHLLSVLPSSHPMHEEFTRFIETWSQDILELGEEAFQAGQLQQAIEAAKSVPKTVASYREAEEKTKRWQGIWTEAESIYRRSETVLRNRNWRQASNESARLLSIENDFWQTKKYRELTGKIASTRQDINTLAKAEELMGLGGLNNFLEVVQLTSGIDDKSYVYQSAQELMVKTGRKMFDLAGTTLERRDLMAALDITRQIPEAANLKKEIEDFNRLANAQAKTWSGTAADIDAAVKDAQGIERDRPLYEKAKQLIVRWQSEKGSLAQLQRAQQLAQSQRPGDLQAAIASAAQIPSSHPRAQEAQQLIKQLTNELLSRQDRPILQKAQQIASRGDAASLQQAIAALNQVAATRTLSEEAQNKRQVWISQLQQLQGAQVFVDAAAPNPLFPSASPDSAGSSPNPFSDNRLSNGASNELPDSTDPANSQGQPQSAEQLQATRSLQLARASAERGTVDAFAEAIRRADGVSPASALRPEAEQYMNQLGQQMLQAASSQAESDLASAIVTANKIPNQTTAYSQAQAQIRVWRQQLQLIRR